MAEQRPQQPFPEDVRNLVLLAVRAGFTEETACRAAEVPKATLDEWRYWGQEDHEAGRDTEPAKFYEALEKTASDRLRTQVVAANVAANAARAASRDDPKAALEYLREIMVADKLKRSRELTAGT